MRFGVVVAGGGGTVFATRTDTGDDVATFPAASRETARMVVVPFVDDAVFHVNSYGALTSSGPNWTPFRKNRTPETPTLSEEDAVTVTIPETVEPLVGAVMATVGGVVSGGGGGGGGAAVESIKLYASVVSVPTAARTFHIERERMPAGTVILYEVVAHAADAGKVARKT
jgi:hypothetical protein